MPIPVVCVSCGAKINAPDAAAGKRAKCPKCAAVLTIPDPSVVEPEDEVEQEEKPSPRPRRRGDEEDDNDRPRKKKSKKPPPRKVNPLIFVAIGVAALLLFGGGVFAVWRFAIREPASKTVALSADGSGSTTKPLTWETVDKPAYSFQFPTGQVRVTDEKPMLTPGGVTAQRQIFARVYMDGKSFQFMHGELLPEGAEAYAANPEAWLESIVDQMRREAGGKYTTATTTVAGVKACEMAIESQDGGRTTTSRARLFVAKNKFFWVSANGLDLDQERIFYDSVKVK